MTKSDEISLAMASALQAVARLRGDTETDAALWSEFITTIKRINAKNVGLGQGSKPKSD